MAGEKTSVFLYPETVALAAWVIVYTLISALCALFTHILFRLNKQKAAYVSLTCIAIFLQQLVTIAQQAIALYRWPHMHKKIWERDAAMWGNPHASTVFTPNPDTYMIITFQIRIYFFNVESLLFFFWAFLLFSSVWEIRWSWVRNQKFIALSRYLAFILPVGVSAVINLPVIQKNATLHLILMDLIMVVTIGCGVIFLLLILFKFVLVAIEQHRSRRLQRIRIQDDRVIQKSSKEDKWIIFRFLAGFFVIGALQTSFLFSQYEYAQHVLTLRDPSSHFPAMGWTKTQQLRDWAYYMAGSSTGILIFVAFGTAPDARTHAKRLFRQWFRCGGCRRNGKAPVTHADAEKAQQNGRDSSQAMFPSENIRESYLSESTFQYSTNGTSNSSHDSITPLTKAPQPVAMTPTLHQHSQNSRLSRPPTDTMFPEVVPSEDAFSPTKYRSAGTSYEDEYYHTGESRDSMNATRPTEVKRERDVVISQYDYRKDGLGRNGTLLRHCVSPLTPEVEAFERFRVQGQPADDMGGYIV